jgi:hypothetical protein
MDAGDRWSVAPGRAVRRATARCRQFWTINVLLLVAGLATPEVSHAAACGSAISACGCTIQKGGLYTVTANLSSSQGLTRRGACIDVNDTNTTLDLKKFTITGSGTGIGIHILPGAYAVAVVGTQCCAVVSSWNIGIEDDEDKADLAFIDVESSVSSGILILGVIDSQLWEVQSNNNGDAGLLIRGKSDNHIFRSSFAHNKQGVRLANSVKNRIAESSADYNGDGIVAGAGSRGNHI